MDGCVDRAQPRHPAPENLTSPRIRLPRNLRRDHALLLGLAAYLGLFWIIDRQVADYTAAGVEDHQLAWVGTSCTFIGTVFLGGAAAWAFHSVLPSARRATRNRICFALLYGTWMLAAVAGSVTPPQAAHHPTAEVALGAVPALVAHTVLAVLIWWMLDDPDDQHPDPATLNLAAVLGLPTPQPEGLAVVFDAAADSLAVNGRVTVNADVLKNALYSAVVDHAVVDGDDYAETDLVRICLQVIACDVAADIYGNEALAVRATSGPMLHASGICRDWLARTDTTADVVDRLRALAEHHRQHDQVPATSG